LRLPAHECAETVAPLESAGDAELLRWGERLREAPRAARAEILERNLLARAAGIKRKIRTLAPAVELLLSGRTGVDAVAGVCGLGPRQLERRFAAEVGLAPGELARVGRLQRAARLLESSLPLAAVALAAGYADQSHFGREFLTFSGTTPAVYRSEAHALAAAFVVGT
jgi:transcriptional regulator GlxA family with amidase domain